MTKLRKLKRFVGAQKINANAIALAFMGYTKRKGASAFALAPWGGVRADY